MRLWLFQVSPISENAEYTQQIQNNLYDLYGSQTPLDIFDNEDLYNNVDNSLEDSTVPIYENSKYENPVHSLENEQNELFDLPIERHRPDLAMIRAYERAYDDYIESQLRNDLDNFRTRSRRKFSIA